MKLRTSALWLFAACQAGRAAEPTQPASVAPSAPSAPIGGGFATTGGAVPMPAFQAQQYALQQEPTATPWSLTASDGSGLALTRVDAKASFQGPLAFTELHL